MIPRSMIHPYDPSAGMINLASLAYPPVMQQPIYPTLNLQALDGALQNTTEAGESFNIHQNHTQVNHNNHTNNQDDEDNSNWRERYKKKQKEVKEFKEKHGISMMGYDICQAIDIAELVMNAISALMNGDFSGAMASLATAFGLDAKLECALKAFNFAQGLYNASGISKHMPEIAHYANKYNPIANGKHIRDALQEGKYLDAAGYLTRFTPLGI